MIKYKTYQEAKIENSSHDVYKIVNICENKKIFFASNFDMPKDLIYALTPCKPSDYCMSVEQFLNNGYKLTAGDIYLNTLGSVSKITLHDIHELTNTDAATRNCDRFVLDAAALKQAEIDTAPQQAESLTLRETAAHETFEKAFDEVEQVECNYWDGTLHPKFGDVVADDNGHLYQYYGLNSGRLIGKPYSEFGLATCNAEFVAIVEGGFFKPETPEQKLEREELEAMVEIFEKAACKQVYSLVDGVKALRDAGYRKVE